ncbi:YceI family protein [Actinocrinis puniceicyclus]|uniref:YceI family protein n=1 Tax=Actinocrinis puniceicyclus TaxID=977794 RepID=A0A8J7WUR2_9ACTN|nr:YceI family protein [Actinocrinis puniceicyclus]MBS2966150.1 YceI family protein [Actinocrinis puniceicyclus]
MTTTSSAIQIPGYVAGTWTIDPVHSDVSFTVRHMVVSKVRGFFRTFEGTLVTGESAQTSAVTASIDMNSIDTNQEQRDAHIRSADFFEVEKYPTMTYRSTAIRPDGGDWIVDGELTLKGVTKQVPLTLELNGFGPDPYGGYRAGFSAKGEIDRKDFNVNFHATLETGGLVVSDKVAIALEIEAVLNKAEDAGAEG